LGYPDAGLDGSWVIGIYWAFARHLQFGKQIIFTYGPLGIIELGTLAEYGLWRLSFLSLLISHVMLFVASFLIVEQTTRNANPWNRLLYSVPILLALALAPAVRQPGEWLGMAAMLLFFVFSGVQRMVSEKITILVFMLSSFLLAIASLIKFNYFLEALLLLVSMTAVLVTRSKGRFKVWSAGPLFYILSLVLIWVLAGQNPFNLGAFVHYGLDISAGYGPAMQYESGSPLELLIGVGSLILFLVTLAYYILRKNPRIISFVTLSGVLLFISFMHGFVRHDLGHVLSFYAVLAPLLAFLSLLTLDDIRADPRRIRHVVPLLAPLALVALVVLSPIALPNTSLGYFGKDSILTRTQIYGEAIRLFEDRKGANSLIDNAKLELRQSYPISNETLAMFDGHTVDVLPWDIAMAYAYGFNWDPAPIFQTYQAYTPALDDLNARHYEGKGAPDFVLYNFESMDGRYPPFDEPHAFRTLICNYELVGIDGQFFILEKRPLCICSDRTILVSTYDTSFGEPVQIPNGNGLLIAKVYIETNFLGKTASLLYKIPAVRVNLQFGNGESHVWGPTASGDFEYIASVGSNGLLLKAQPPVDNMLTPSVDTFAFYTNGPQYYASEIRIEFYSIDAVSQAQTSQTVANHARDRSIYIPLAYDIPVDDKINARQAEEVRERRCGLQMIPEANLSEQDPTSPFAARDCYRYGLF
jgi:hypothetical protein